MRRAGRADDAGEETGGPADRVSSFKWFSRAGGAGASQGPEVNDPELADKLEDELRNLD